MNESATAPSKSGSSSIGRTDRQTLAHVEKWLAVIREISSARGK